MAERIRRRTGRVALFAHSQGGIPTAMALRHFDLPQIDPSDVIFAGTPLDSSMSRERTLRRSTDDPDAHTFARESLNMPADSIHSVIRAQPSRPGSQPRYTVITPEHIESYPDRNHHLLMLQKLGESTLLVAGNETVTDCTVENVRQLLPGRIVSEGEESPSGNTIVIEGAEHNLRGYCDSHIPTLLASKVLGMTIN